MAKVSARHQADIDIKNWTQRENLAYCHIMRAMVNGTGRWGTLQRVGSVYDKGDSYVWQLAFSPRLRDAVIMETFTSAHNGDQTVRVFFLEDARQTYYARSFDSTDVLAKIQQLYLHALEMERREQNKVA